MTDNEIIKAFKDFLIEQVDGYTDHIETGGERYEFIEKELELLKETDDLINRQKAEIERLTDTLNATIAGQETLQRYIITAKAEAYKEFAERLKAEMLKSKYNITTSSYSRACNAVIDFWVEEIDNLVKELVGEQNG